jgi:hypothetical protein
MRRTSATIMQAGRSRILPGAALAVLLLAFAAPIPGEARERGFPAAEERLRAWSGALPACDDPAVLSRISRGFDAREQRFWNGALRLAEITHPRQLALRPWGQSHIPRRFCQARARIETGVASRNSRVDYIITEGTGLFGGWGVEWCTAAFVRHQHAGPDCRAMRP